MILMMFDYIDETMMIMHDDYGKKYGDGDNGVDMMKTLDVFNVASMVLLNLEVILILRRIGVIHKLARASARSLEWRREEPEGFKRVNKTWSYLLASKFLPVDIIRTGHMKGLGTVLNKRTWTFWP